MRIVARVAAATGGAYAVTAGSAALIAVLLVGFARLSRSDALIWGSSLSYLLFAGFMLWCFAERRLSRVVLVLLIAAAATHGVAFAFERDLSITSDRP